MEPNKWWYYMAFDIWVHIYQTCFGKMEIENENMMS